MRNKAAISGITPHEQNGDRPPINAAMMMEYLPFDFKVVAMML